MAFVGAGDFGFMENPQAEDGQALPGPRPMPHWGWEQGPGADFGNLHAMSATTSAYQFANEASKNATSLAQWVQYLYLTIQQLQDQVTQLEDWKKKALDDVRKLREEHKLLRLKVLGEDRPEDQFPGLIQRSKSTPPHEHQRLMEGGHVHQVVPSPPGLDLPLPPPGPPPPQPTGDRQATARLPLSPVRREVYFVEQAVCDGQHVSLRGRNAAATSDDQPSCLTRDDTADSGLAASLPGGLSISELADCDAAQLEGVHVSQALVDGVECERAEWRIGHLSTRLRGCMGRPLVSSPFRAVNLEDLRLMVSADNKELAKGPRSRRQKELYAKKVSEGPLDGCLKLKVPSCPPNLNLQFYLKVGSIRRGPFRHNFAESTVSACDDFNIDWLKQLEPDQSLTVCVEIIRDSMSQQPQA